MVPNVESLLDLLTSNNISGFDKHDPLHSRSEPKLFSPSTYVDTNGLITQTSSKSSLNVISLNCQSLNAKFDQLQILLYILISASCDLHVLCLQESWLNSDSDTSLLQIDGYEMLHKPQKISKHGGLVMYVRKDLHYKLLPSVPSTIFESQIIELHFNNRPIVIGNFYRPPKAARENEAIATFTDEFKGVLETFSSRPNVVLSGDFNMNLLKLNENDVINSMVDNLMSLGFVPSITLPTRFAEQYGTSSLIDNIFLRTNFECNSYSTCILTTKISDHFACCLSLFLPPNKYIGKKPPKTVTITSYSPENIQNFIDYLSNINFHEVLIHIEDEDPDTNYKIFASIIEEARRSCFPSKSVKFNRHRHRHKEWISNGIITSISHRDSMLRKLRKTPVTSEKYLEMKSDLHRFDSILKKSIRVTKQSYYARIFDEYKGNMRKTWTAISEVLSRGRSARKAPDYFLINSIAVSDSTKIANLFNEFFSNIGEKLAASQEEPSSNVTFESFLGNRPNAVFSFRSVDSEEILKIIDSIKSKSSFGYDSISSKVLKSAKFQLVSPLTLLINQTLKTGKFPTLLKIAKVSPIHKKGDEKLLDNYRPISLLSTFSKVFEKAIYLQLYEYFTSNSLLYGAQYGFRTGHSTDLAAVNLVDDILNLIEADDIPFSVFIDLSKAFDTLNYSILLYKLQHYGLDRRSLTLLESYLTNREQFVNYNGSSSTNLKIKTGVPQGSILGPLLFIIYINDISNSTQCLKTLSYADDTTLTGSVNSITLKYPNVAISDAINIELQKISDWLLVNKLSLNVNKSKFMIFHSAQKFVDFSQFNLSIMNQALERVENFTFLGLTLDTRMNWKAHIQRISSKISKIAGILSRLKHSLPINVLLTIYNSLLLPHINYGILTWGFSNTTRILKLQKRAVRFICNENYNAHTDPLFKRLSLLKIDHIFLCNLLKFYYRHCHLVLPVRLAALQFDPILQDDHQTRYKTSRRTAYTKRKFSSQCVRHGIPKLIYWSSGSINFSHTYSNDAFETNFNQDKLTSAIPRPLLSVLINCIKNHSFTLQGFTRYAKLKIIETYIV